jgi:AcrR family transcriptional regulator
LASEAASGPAKRAATGSPRTAGRRNAPAPRIGSETSRVRQALLDAAEQIMRKEGYSAVTSRAVARQAGLKPQLVHYYFRTMEDLFLALVRRYTDKRIKRQAQTLASPTPLKAAWAFSHDDPDTALAVEFLALARRHKSVRAELARAGELIREMQGHLYAKVFRDYELEPYFGSPDGLAVIIDAVGRALGLEADVGLTHGHAQVLEVVQRWIERFEGGGEKLPGQSK